MKNIRKEIIDYIEKNIFPSYEKNDKGHEDYQIVKGVKYHLDDMECVLEGIKK